MRMEKLKKKALKESQKSINKADGEEDLKAHTLPRKHAKKKSKEVQE